MEPVTKPKQGLVPSAPTENYLGKESKDQEKIVPSLVGLSPPKFSFQRRYAGPKPQNHTPVSESEETIGSSHWHTSSIRHHEPGGYDTPNHSYHPSETSSSKSSIVDEPAVTAPSKDKGNHAGDPFKPVAPPKKVLVKPKHQPPVPRAPTRVSTSSDEEEVRDHRRQSPDEDAISSLPRAHEVVELPRSSALPAQETKTQLDAGGQLTELQKRGKRKMLIHKMITTLCLIGLNFIFIFASWWWTRYYYVYLPFIALPLILNCIMITSIICFKLRNTIRPEKMIQPDHLENLIMVMPCYNETFEECSRSLDSLVNQVKIEEHRRGILVVCDGRVRGPGMEKTTADYLLEDIFVDCAHRERIKNAYTAWDGQKMGIEISIGSYKGMPYYCIVKDQNQGKRDSLIVVRSFLYKYNVRRTNPDTIFSARLLHSLTDWLGRDVQADQIDHLIGMDADTIFDTDCIYQLLQESKYPNTVGVCGYVAVDFSNGQWNIWSLYQNAEYTIAQGLRRLHQSLATKKVSCLPGCCQLLRICEWSCGDKVLVELFGYHPSPTDGMLKQIRATASEDRNHVCLMLTTCPKAQTRQALKARAFTDVPHSWSVFLSQRRRWTLGATSNDLLLFTARHCQWWERILAFSNVLVWSLNVFIVAAIGCMIVAFMSQPWWIIMCFAGVMIIPLIYYIIIAVSIPRTLRDKLQYLAGLFTFVVCGPFLNITIMLFAVYNMDSFGWGKTRLVVAEEVKEKQPAGRDESASSTTMERDGRYDEEVALGVMVARPGATRAVGVPP